MDGKDLNQLCATSSRAIASAGPKKRFAVRKKVIADFAAAISETFGQPANRSVLAEMICYRASRQIENLQADAVLQEMAPLLSKGGILADSPKAHFVYVKALIGKKRFEHAIKYLERIMQRGEVSERDANARATYESLCRKNQVTPSFPARVSSSARSAPRTFG